MEPTDAQRTIRLELYRGAEQMRAAIGMIEGDRQAKAELINLVVVAHRMAMLMNDGRVSPQEIRAF